MSTPRGLVSICSGWSTNTTTLCMLRVLSEIYCSFLPAWALVHGWNFSDTAVFLENAERLRVGRDLWRSARAFWSGGPYQVPTAVSPVLVCSLFLIHELLADSSSILRQIAMYFSCSLICIRRWLPSPCFCCLSVLKSPCLSIAAVQSSKPSYHVSMIPTKSQLCNCTQVFNSLYLFILKNTYIKNKSAQMMGAIQIKALFLPV